MSEGLKETLCSQDTQTVVAKIIPACYPMSAGIASIIILKLALFQTTHMAQFHSLKEPRGLFAHPTNKQHQKDLPLWYACPFTLPHPPHTPHPSPPSLPPFPQAG